MIPNPIISKPLILWAVAVAFLGACAALTSDHPGEDVASGAGDPLPGWKDTAVKQAILDYVADISQPGAPGYIPPQDRVATLDFDGTIGCEKPDFMEVMLAASRLCELTETDSDLLDEELYRAACDGDLKQIDAEVETALLTAFDGESQSFYLDYVREFIHSHHHPRFDRPYAQLYYVPMRQLIDLLHANGFVVYIVSGSQQGFTRGFGTGVLGLAAPRLIGSNVELDFVFENGASSLIRQDSFRAPSVGGKGKAEIIRNRIGQQPVFAFGNSMGDFEMLQYATSSPYPSLGLILVHDDPEEYVYSDQELLQHAEQYGWQIVSMRESFKVLFPG